MIDKYHIVVAAADKYHIVVDAADKYQVVVYQVVVAAAADKNQVVAAPNQKSYEKLDLPEKT